MMSIARKFDIEVYYNDNPIGPPAVVVDVDPDKFWYLDLVSSVMNMAPNKPKKGFSISFDLEYMVNLTEEKKTITDDKGIMNMFEVNKNFKFIHVYATACLFEIVNTVVPDHSSHGDENVFVISSSDEDYGGEEDSENDSSSEHIVGSEELRGVYSCDELSEAEDKFDKPGDVNSDDDRHRVHVDRGMAGKRFEIGAEEKVNLEIGMLFTNVIHFRKVLRNYIIQEGFETKWLKNENSRVTVICSIEGCDWRIHASPTHHGGRYMIKTYQSVHNCMRQTKNKDAKSDCIAEKLKTKLREDRNMSYDETPPAAGTAPESQPSKKRKTNRKVQIQVNEADGGNEDEDEGAGGEGPRKAAKSLAHKSRSIYKATAILKSKNLPGFMVLMRQSYVEGRCIAIPKEFSQKYLKQGDVLLKVGGRTWTVKFKIWKDTTNTRLKKYKLQNGWYKFRIENCLEVNDVCVFVLTNITEVTFDVHIIR